MRFEPACFLSHSEMPTSLPSFNIHVSCWHGFNNLTEYDTFKDCIVLQCLLWKGFYSWKPSLIATTLQQEQGVFIVTPAARKNINLRE